MKSLVEGRGNRAEQDDVDGDRVGDPCDVCPDVADPEQEDDDFDGRGNACTRVDAAVPSPRPDAGVPAPQPDAAIVWPTVD